MNTSPNHVNLNQTNRGSDILYSLLKLFTGLANAAFIV